MANKDKNINDGGYDYNLNLNQIGAINAGLQGKINADEILIFESFIKYTTWNGCQKIIRNNVIYYHYPWQNVVKRIPFLNLNSRSPIKNRFKKLVDNNLLMPHPDNEGMSKSFYAFGVLYDQYSNFKREASPSLTKDAHRPQPRTHRPQPRTLPSLTKDATVLNEGRSPSLTKDAYDSNSDITNDITNDIFLKKEFQKFKNFEHTWNAWKDYLKKKKKDFNDQEHEEYAFQHLINISDGNLAIAKRIITQARADGKYTNLIPLIGSQKKYSASDFPDEWDSNFFSKLKPDQIPKYYKHLKERGFTPVKHNGQTIKWAIPQTVD